MRSIEMHACMIPKQALTQESLEESCLMIHIRMSMSMCWRGVYVQHTHSGRTGHWAANAVRITILKKCHTRRPVFLCLTHCSSSSFAPRARKRRPMSEEEEEVQDQKQTIDAKCKARTQRALP